MRIGFDAKRLYANFTGLGNYSRTLLRNLQSVYSEHQYRLYTPAFREHAETAYFQQHEGMNTIVAQTPFSFYWRSFSLAGQLERDLVDVYHGLSNEIPFPSGRSSVKTVVTIHDLIFKELPKTYAFFDRQIYDLKFRKSCERADRVIAISEYTKQDIIRFYQIDPAKIEVIYQACSPVFYQDLSKNGSDKLLSTYPLPSEYLLYVGSIIPRKNVKLVLQGLTRMEPAKRIPLVIVGSGANSAYGREVKQFIQKHHLQDLVIWITNLKDNQALQVLYQKAQALIYPSHYEGFGLPVTEALLSKTPVITSKATSLPEAGGPDSMYIDPNQPDELAQAIEQVLHDSSLREKMIQSGYQYAWERFHPKHLSDQLMELYQSL
ncbi:MAG: glycosyltransferase family 1 protein [Bacteroidota bacterium]